MTFAFVRTFLATDFFVFALARGLGVLVLLPEPGFEGVDFLAACPPLGMASFIGRVDVVAFDAERDTAIFLSATLAFGLLVFFLDFATEDFSAGISTSYPYTRIGPLQSEPRKLSKQFRENHTGK